MIPAAVIAAVVVFALGWITARIPAMRRVRGERALTAAIQRKHNDLLGGLLTLHATLLGSDSRAAGQLAAVIWPADEPTEVLDFARFRRDLRLVGEEMAAEGHFIAAQIEGQPPR